MTSVLLSIVPSGRFVVVVVVDPGTGAMFACVGKDAEGANSMTLVATWACMGALEARRRSSFSRYRLPQAKVKTKIPVTNHKTELAKLNDVHAMASDSA